MKIACITFAASIAMKNLCLALKHRGHDVRVFSIAPEEESWLWGGFRVYKDRWEFLELRSLFSFNPDVVIMWNGYSDWTYAATMLIKSKFPIAHVECAWLPQADNYYIAEHLAAHANSIMNIGEADINSPALAALKTLYANPRIDPELPEKFVFIPAQLAYDTSVVVSSPLFKTCDSLIGACRHFLPDVPIVVNNHPKQRDVPRLASVINYNGPLKSIELAAQSTVVVGITSTVLTEALIYDKPVASFGYNVGMSSHIHRGFSKVIHTFDIIRKVYEQPELFKNFRLVSADRTLAWLLSKQWRADNVPEWVCEFVEKLPERELERL